MTSLASLTTSDLDADFDKRYKGAYSLDAIFDPSKKIPVREYVRALAVSKLSYESVAEIKQSFDTKFPDAETMFTRATLIFLTETAPVFPSQVDDILERLIKDASASNTDFSYTLAGNLTLLGNQGQIFSLRKALMAFLSKDFHPDDLERVQSLIGTIDNLRSQPALTLKFVADLEKLGKSRALEALLRAIASESLIMDNEASLLETAFSRSKSQFSLFFEMLNHHPELLDRPSISEQIFNFKSSQLKEPVVAQFMILDRRIKLLIKDPVRKRAYEKFLMALAVQHPEYLLAVENARIDFTARKEDPLKPFVEIAKRTLERMPRSTKLLTYQPSNRNDRTFTCEGFYSLGN